jgi:RNA polymerase sigma-70 factor (ECF subfamily)
MAMAEEEFARLVDAHYGALFRFAVSLTRSEADASDLTQQTFYIWAAKGHTIRDRAKAKTWLFTTLYREFIRARRRDQRISSLEDLSPAEQDPPDVDHDQLARFDHAVVLDALQEIDPVFRAALVLFYLKDLTYHEIAEILDVPIGTVMSRLNRGKAHLRAVLARRLAGSKLIEFPKLQAP